MSNLINKDFTLKEEAIKIANILLSADSPIFIELEASI